jgi:HSP20 family molecular chaperone IbpA
MKTLSFLSAFALLITGSLTAQSTASSPVTLSDTVKTDGARSVSITGLRGMKVSVRGHDSRQLMYAWTVRGSGRQFEEILAKSSVDARMENSVLVIRVSTPENMKDYSENNDESWLKQLISPSKNGSKSRWNNELSQQFEVLMPKDLLLNLNSNYSEIRILGIKAGVKAENRAGQITVSATAGDMDVNNQYGRTDISDHEGNVLVKGKSGSISVADTRGNMQLTSDYSTITVARHTGDLKVENQSGKITVDELNGNGVLRGKYGNITVSAVTGKLEVFNNSGSVQVDDASTLHIENEYGSITLSKIKASAPGVVKASNGSVNLSRVQSDLTVHVAYGSVESKDGKGSLTVNAGDGSVRVDRHSGNIAVKGDDTGIRLNGIQAESVQLETRGRSIDASFDKIIKLQIDAEDANVSLNLPGKPDGQVDVHVEDGTINGNALDITRFTTRGAIKSAEYGSGTSQLRIRLVNGTLTARTGAF